MFKKIDFKGLNYRDLERYSSHDLKRDEMNAYYQTFDFLELIKQWPKIVGPKMASVTSPLKLQQDSLFIITENAAFSHELSYLSEEIKKETFKVFPHLRTVIKKLSFQTREGFFKQQKIQQEEVRAQTQKLHPQSPQYKILKLEAEKTFAHIEEAELKTVLISLYIQSRQA
jgi:hypothetical protein